MSLNLANKFVHSGDSILDASLFQRQGERDDISTYQSLYGLTPTEVLEDLSKFNVQLPIRFEALRLFTDTNKRIIRKLAMAELQC